MERQLIVILFFPSDTSFMFIIGGLVMIKLFQLRHPNRNKNAHVAFVLFSFVVFVTLLGIVSHVHLSVMCLLRHRLVGN